MATFLGGHEIPNAGIETPNSPQPEWQGGSVAVTRRYWVPTDNLVSFLAGLSSSDTDPDWTDAVLVSVSVSQVGGSNSVKEVEKRFEPSGWSFTIFPSGVTQGASTVLVDQPVKKAPSSPGEAEVEAAKAAGIESLRVPMPSYTRKAVTSGSYTWSEANIIDNVGKVDDTPEGMTSPTAGKWLMSSHKVTEQGGTITEDWEWQYDSVGWNTPVALYLTVA